MVTLFSVVLGSSPDIPYMVFVAESNAPGLTGGFRVRFPSFTQKYNNMLVDKEEKRP
jgi:hypothetical protein